MSAWLRGLFARAWQAWHDPARAAARLARDAREVIDSAAAATDEAGRESLRSRLLERLSEAELVMAAGTGSGPRLLARYQALHREARTKRDMDEFTVLTLAIIHLRAQRIGPAADAARERVEAAWQG